MRCILVRRNDPPPARVVAESVPSKRQRSGVASMTVAERIRAFCDSREQVLRGMLDRSPAVRELKPRCVVAAVLERTLCEPTSRRVREAMRRELVRRAERIWFPS